MALLLGLPHHLILYPHALGTWLCPQCALVPRLRRFDFACATPLIHKARLICGHTLCLGLLHFIAAHLSPYCAPIPRDRHPCADLPARALELVAFRGPVALLFVAFRDASLLHAARFP